MEQNLPSPFGKMSLARYRRGIAATSETYSKHSQAGRFLCLTVESGRLPAWCGLEALKSLGGSWIPAISEAPNRGEGCSLWRIIAERAQRKYYLTPRLCTKYLALARKAGTRFPEKVEAVLLKQGGRMPR